MERLFERLVGRGARLSAGAQRCSTDRVRDRATGVLPDPRERIDVGARTSRARHAQAADTVEIQSREHGRWCFVVAASVLFLVMLKPEDAEPSITVIVEAAQYSYPAPANSSKRETSLLDRLQFAPHSAPSEGERLGARPCGPAAIAPI